MTAVFAMRAKGIKDEQVMDITSKLLIVNPDVQTLWNYRREVLLEWRSLAVEQTNQVNQEDQTSPEEVFDSKCRDELLFVEQCLPKNPKSYSCWHHRQWILQSMFKPDIDRELQLCDFALSKDSRNFHTWDHRKFLADTTGLALAGELEFTEKQIHGTSNKSEGHSNRGNFSNFSAWFVRACLLTEGHDKGLLDMKTQWDEEYYRIANAIFVEPNDQSAWFYHKWLTSIDLGNNMRTSGLHNKPPGEVITITQVVLSPDLLTIRFSRPTVSPPDVKVTVDGEDFDVVCSMVTDIDCRHLQAIWSFRYRYFSGLPVQVKFQNQKPIDIQCKNNSITVLTKKDFREFQDFQSQPKLKEENLQNLRELLNSDQDWAASENKFLNLTLAYFESHENRLKMLEKLTQLDPLRKSYYQDQKSRLVQEREIERRSSSPVDASSDYSLMASLSLTRLYSPHRLVHLRHLDLSGNCFTSFTRTFNDLVNLEVLVLDDNQIDFIEEGIQLISLKILSLKKNLIASPEQVLKLGRSIRLKKALLFGNPFLVKEGVHELMGQFPPLVLDDVCVKDFLTEEDKKTFVVFQDFLND